MTLEKISIKSALDPMWYAHVHACGKYHPSGDADAECIERFRALAKKVQYRDWRAVVHNIRNTPFVQITAIVEDTVNGGMMENSTRPIVLCNDMSDGFFVDLVFELIKEFELHEAAERFKFDGKAVFYPHGSDGMPLQELPSMRSLEDGQDKPQLPSAIAEAIEAR